MMQRLALEAQIKTTGRIHSHLIRKWVMSGLSRAGFNDFQIKYVMGKNIPASDATYLQTLDQEIEERYPAAYQNYLSLKSSPTAINSLAGQIKERDQEIDTLKSEVAELRDMVMKQTATMQKLIDKTQQ